MLSLGELKASNEMPNACNGAPEGCKQKEPARTAPGRSSLRNEPSAKGMALTAGCGSPPHHVPEPCVFGVASGPSKALLSLAN